MKIKAPLLFLFANVLLAFFVLINFAFKSHTNPSSLSTIISNSQSQPREEIITSTSPNKDVELKTGPLTLSDSNSQPKVCLALGPLTSEEAPLVEKIISQNGLQKTTHLEKKPIIEIYWNLGPNEQVANELFTKQKTTTMTNPKFTLKKSGSDWIVPITLVSNVEQAKNIITDLAGRANKSGAGGRWQYRTKSDTYNYSFQDISLISMSALEQIKTIAPDRLGKCD